MSMHKSLRLSGRFAGARNVLSRAERIRKLQKDGRRGPDASVFGLPKVRVIKLKHRKKKEEEAAVETAEGAVPGAAAPGAAAPEAAPSAKPGKGEAPKRESKK